MPRNYKPGLDWPSIRERYESGETATEIQRTADVTRQGIEQRAKREGWIRKVITPAVAHGQLTSIAAVEAMGSRTDANAKMILDELMSGAHPPLAARRVGMAPETLVAWMRDDPIFGQRCIEAQITHTRAIQGEINDAVKRDWKAGAYLLERHPLTKAEFKTDSDKGKQGITVVINLPERGTEPIIVEGQCSVER